MTVKAVILKVYDQYTGDYHDDYIRTIFSICPDAVVEFKDQSEFDGFKEALSSAKCADWKTFGDIQVWEIPNFEDLTKAVYESHKEFIAKVEAERKKAEAKKEADKKKREEAKVKKLAKELESKKALLEKLKTELGET
jgi:hypothetical protein